MPEPLHRLAKPVAGDFLGSVKTMDYYLSHDLEHIRIVRAGPGHKIVTEQALSAVVQQLQSWGEHDMVNRIRAAKAMLDD